MPISSKVFGPLPGAGREGVGGCGGGDASGGLFAGDDGGFGDCCCCCMVGILFGFGIGSCIPGRPDELGLDPGRGPWFGVPAGVLSGREDTLLS